MHPVPGSMHILCAENIAAKKSVSRETVSSQARKRAYGNGF